MQKQVLTLQAALGQSETTEKIVEEMAASSSSVVRKLAARFQEARVDVSEAEALAAGNPMQIGAAKTALAIKQMLRIRQSVQGLRDVARTIRERGGTRGEARRALLDALAGESDRNVAALAQELREEEEQA